MRSAEIQTVMDAASEVFTPEGVRIWMVGKNALLDGRTPTEAVEEGDWDKVLDLIEALATGAVF